MSITDHIIERLRSEHLTTWLGIIAVIVAIGTLSLAAVYGPDILDSTSAVEDGTLIQGCRSSYNADVTDRRTDFDVARSHRDRANAELQVLTNEITDEAVFGTEERATALREGLPALRQEVLDRNVDVQDAEDRLQAANERYQQAVTLSIQDPTKFMSLCQEARI